MTESRVQPDLVVAIFFAGIFLAIAAALSFSGITEMFGDPGEVNVFLQPYFHFMIAAALGNAALILMAQQLGRRFPGRIASGTSWAAVTLSTLIVVELVAGVAVRSRFGEPHVGSRFTNGFVFSPSMSFVPKPGFEYPIRGGMLTHTKEGYRGPEMPDDPSGTRKTVLAVGGSSTYDLGLPDDQTWPADLGRAFADQIRLLNLGVPGHSTAEHITMVALNAWKHRPDVIVYYIGWNDIRSSHVGEATDYGRFHKKQMLRDFEITEPTSFFALEFLAAKVIAGLDPTSLSNLSATDAEPQIGTSVDQALLETYLQNVRTLAAITRELGAVPVFVPQILNNERLSASGAPYGWIPGVPQNAVPDVMKAFNEAMLRTAQAEGAIVIPEVLDVDWSGADFVDLGHFSARGATRFACALAAGLIRSGLVADKPGMHAGAVSDCKSPLANG